MNIGIIGAGPAGLYLAILLRRSGAGHRIRIVEQNARDATFGFGVAFSQRALGFLRDRDEETWAAIGSWLECWDDSLVSLNGESVRIDGIGYAGIARLRLLNLLQEIAEKSGITVEYGRVLVSPDELAGCDLIVGADGANSIVRRSDEAGFGAAVSQFANRFAWFGTRRHFDSLTHTFLATPHGAFNAHHHRHAPDMSTFVVDVDEPTFLRCGFESMGPNDAQSFCETIFAPVLNGNRLISNKSIWRRFQRVSNRHWWSGNRVLLGDALHTAHFSIGSGTRMAMEDAAALAEAVDAHGGDLPAIFAAFEQARRPASGRLIAAADKSAQWYESFADHMRLPLMEFAMSYITRSGRVGMDELRRSSAGFVAQYEKYRQRNR